MNSVGAGGPLTIRPWGLVLRAGYPLELPGKLLKILMTRLRFKIENHFVVA